MSSRRAYLLALAVSTQSLACSSNAADPSGDAGIPDAAVSGSGATPAAGSGGRGGRDGAAGEARAGTGGAGGQAGAAHGGEGGKPAAATGGMGGGTGGKAGMDASAGGSGAPQPGKTRLIGVGSFGLRGRSDDATGWSYCGNAASGDEHTPDLLRGVAYGDGVFIAVGGDANGRVMRSVDGEHWDEDVHPVDACPGEGYPSSCKNWMGAVAYLDGVWLAGGGNGATMRSQDGGRTWSGLHHDFPEKHIRTLGAGAGRFIAGTDGGALHVTSDAGDSWSTKDIWSSASNSAYLQVVYGDNTFIAYSEERDACFVSRDLGESWQPCPAAAQGGGSYLFDGAGKQWVAAIGGAYATSPDAASWTKHTASSFPEQLQADSEAFYGRSGTTFYRGNTLDKLTAAGMHVADFRAWTLGRVLPENQGVTSPAACADNR